MNVVADEPSQAGVAGFTLGGGLFHYSRIPRYKWLIKYVAGYPWKTNQYGLTIDAAIAFKFVKPDGNVVAVTKASDPNLFFGLKVCVLALQCIGLD